MRRRRLQLHKSQARVLFQRMGLCLMGLLPLACLPAAFGQSATVTDVRVTGVNASFANGGGFTIVSDGSLTYGGSLNAIRSSDPPSLRIELNGEELLNGVPAPVAEALPLGTVRSNVLSPELQAARLNLDQSPAGVVLGIGGTVATYTAAGATVQTQRIESVGGQTLSIFPDLLPSVFNRGVLR
jgi:hypothetical protein